MTDVSLAEWRSLVARGKAIMDDLTVIPDVAAQIEALQAANKKCIVQIIVDPRSFTRPTPEFMAIDATKHQRTINNASFIMIDGSLCDRPKSNQFNIVGADDRPTLWHFRQYGYVLEALSFVHGLYLAAR